MNFKLISVICLSILLIGTISAMDWDNIKEFKAEGKYGTIEVYNSFIIPGIIKGDKLAEYTLIENTDQCSVNCHAIGSATLYSSDTLFDDYDFVNKKDEKKALDYNIYLEVENKEEIIITDYEQQCSDVTFSNSTTYEVCSQVETGIHKEEVITYSWQEYKGEVLSAGNYRWKLEGKKEDNTNIDWAVGMAGISTKEVREHWAWWSDVCVGVGGSAKVVDNYCVHTINETGTFNITSSIENAEVLIVAGGGGGGSQSHGNAGGGGAGGLIHNSSYNITGNISVTVGLGGGISGTNGIQGFNSVFGIHTAIGGGYGGVYNNGIGGNGGSGGGAGQGNGAGGTATAGQGNDGGGSSTANSAHGGGGAGIAGMLGNATWGGFGGTGLSYDINGTSVYYAGGGGGGTHNSGGTNIALGGQGGGGNSKTGDASTLAQPGTDGLGGGGGGGGESTNGAKGGNGVVIVKYLSSDVTAVLSSPIDNYFTTDTTPDLSCNFSSYELTKISNVTIEIFDSSTNLDYTNTDLTPAGITQRYNKTWTTSTLTDDSYNWSCSVFGDGSEFYQTNNRTLTIDTANPNINIISPTGNINYFKLGNNLSLNWSLIETNKDICWFNYNDANTTVICDAGNYSFIPVENKQSLIFYANDTYGNMGSNTTNWSYSVLENNVSYTLEEFESESTQIIGNFTLGSEPSSVILVYNGTNYTSSILPSNGNTLFSNTVTTPVVSSDQNISFFYLIDVESQIQTQTHNQTIKNIEITTTCPSSFDIINITNYNEISLNQISGTVEFTFNFLNSDESLIDSIYGNSTGETIQLCSDVNLSTSSTLYNMQLRYYKTGYAFKTYNIENSGVNTLPIAIDLYYLNSSLGTEFQMSYKDYLYLEHPGAIIQIQKQYLSENSYRVVEIPLIADDGSVSGTFSTDNIKYKIIVIEDGEILDIFENQFPKCQNIVLGTCEINLLGDSDDGLVDGDDFTYSIVQGDMDITITYIIPSGEPKSVQLVTNQSSRFLDDISSCTQSSFASGGTLTCDYNETVGDSQLQVEISINNEPELQGNLLISTNVNALFLSNNYFIAFIMILTLTTIFIASGTMMILSALVGIFYLGFIFLIKMDSLNVTLVATSIMWLIIAGGTLIFKLAQKEERS